MGKMALHPFSEAVGVNLLWKERRDFPGGERTDVTKEAGLAAERGFPGCLHGCV